MRPHVKYFGRDSLAKEIIGTAKRNGAVLLFGGRQSGKTSLLLHIRETLNQISADTAILSDIDIAVYVDLMELPHDAGPSNFFSLLADKTLESCKLQIAGFKLNLNIDASSISQAPESFVDRLKTIRDACGEVDAHLIFLLDESKRVLGDRFPRGFQDNLFTLLYGDIAPAGVRISIVFSGGQHLYKFSQDETSPIGSRAGYHFIGNLNAISVQEMVFDAIPDLDGITANVFADEIYKTTGGQASLSAKMISMFSKNHRKTGPQKSLDEIKDLLITENLGLFRNWTLAFTPEGAIIRDELALHDKLSTSDIASKLNQLKKDRFLTQRTREELQYMGIAVFEEELICRSNKLFWNYVKEFDLSKEYIDSSTDTSTWELIKKTELALREIIRLKYALQFSDQALANIKNILGEETWQKIDTMIKKSVKSYPYSREIIERDPLSCIYFGDLMTLIINNKIWSLFKSMFKDKRQLEDIVKAIIPVRNDSAHFIRTPEKELNRCRINCDDLLVILEKEMSKMNDIELPIV